MPTPRTTKDRAPKALFFDSFGTVVDWRRSIAQQAAAILEPPGHRLDWVAFADAAELNTNQAWRTCARAECHSASSTFSIAGTSIAFCRGSASRALPSWFGQEFQSAWHRLDAWPDPASGLARLRRKFLIAPVSNGNFSIMADLARRNGFIWDAILGAEHARDFKPKPQVYLAAAEAFDLEPGACMMVAAHSGDLKAAAACGLQTAHVARPDEHGPGQGEIGPTLPVNVAANSLEDLADKLGA